MSLTQFLFSFRGRVNRRANFAFYLAQNVLSLLIGYAYLWYFVPHEIGDAGAFWPAMQAVLAALWPLWLFNLLLLWSLLAVAVKRCHDRGRSAWFLLLFLVPLVQIWPFIELVFLRGTMGDNRYGPDPLEGRPRQTWKSWAIFAGFMLVYATQFWLGDPWQGVVMEMRSVNPHSWTPVQYEI